MFPHAPPRGDEALAHGWTHVVYGPAGIVGYVDSADRARALVSYYTQDN